MQYKLSLDFKILFSVGLYLFKEEGVFWITKKKGGGEILF